MRKNLERNMREFWIARGAILVTAALNAVLINNLTIFPWWLASVVEVALLVPLSVATAWNHGQMRKATGAHHWIRIHHHRRIIRRAAIVLTAIITLINFQALFVVLHALLYGAKGTTGQSLLVDALNIWLTNVVVFALWFWNLDRGGPAGRDAAKEPVADFMFPQMGSGCPGGQEWTPGFFDYVFVSFTNATAFSPTDTVPLTARVKILFMVQASASLLTVGLVAARAVNILA
ncbi:hypothetical protein [Massilia litorea]|uniref:DUF1345 domain-containing protein n=1 Tax=Massilia litorea TaxID=2769491 RepID=A0A7L9U524_9BURK|nr:hypothetical protein [Massilia litorea]QOL49940.1 hypothetical protein LPB04_00975 [Massilia litorea]